MKVTKSETLFLIIQYFEDEKEAGTARYLKKKYPVVVVRLLRRRQRDGLCLILRRGRGRAVVMSEEERRARMCAVNPVYVLRNWMMQEAIADAEKNDFQKVRFLLELSRKPFEVNEEAEKLGYSAQPPSWSYGLKLSCSS